MFPWHGSSYLAQILEECDGDTTAAAERVLEYGDKPRETLSSQSPAESSTSTTSACLSGLSFQSSSLTLSLEPGKTQGSVPSQPATAGPSTSGTTACSSGLSSESSQGAILTPSMFDFEPSTSPEELLACVSKIVIRQGVYVDLTLHRDRIWRTALGFYKQCMKDPDQLRREVRIEFDGEEGIDAGALRNEFFELLLRQINDQLFEGRDNSRLPKKDSNLQRLFECAGVIIAHSVFQGGPAFPCLCAAAFNYIIYLDKDKALQEIPTIDDIPQNAATSGLLTLISSVSFV